jgi:HEAT repeat protein
MTEDPAVGRAAVAAALGQRRALDATATADLERTARDDVDARVRAAALAALVRASAKRTAVRAWTRSVTDVDAQVRKRAADLAPELDQPAMTVGPLADLLADDDVLVVEAAAWALGEQPPRSVPPETIAALATTATNHGDALAREAAVAALGALGEPAGLEAILAACTDKPAVRRRAVLALASYRGPDVDQALQQALQDKDWQVRQAAEDLLRVDEGSSTEQHGGPLT